MYDGYGGINLNESPRYIPHNNLDDNFYDIGPHSYSQLCNMIDDADIIFWNGSMGIIEDSRYAKGSIALVKYLCSIKNKTIIIGGGETASLFKEQEYGDNLFISTGGGALLEYIYSSLIENKPLPGLELFCE